MFCLSAGSVAVWLLTIILPTAQPFVLDLSRFNQRIQDLLDNELGVTFMQRYLEESTTSHTDIENGDQLAEQLAGVLERKFKARTDAVNKLKVKIEESLDLFTPEKNMVQCCKLSKAMTYNDDFKTEVLLGESCLHVSQFRNDILLYPPRPVLTQFKSNLEEHPHITWQFIALESGLTVSYPARKAEECDFDARFRPWYIETAAPLPKDVVIIVDRSGSMNRLDMKTGMKFMDIAKETSRTYLKSLSVRDRVGIVSFSSHADVAAEPTLGRTKEVPCVRHQLVWAASRVKTMMGQYIDTLSSDGGSEYHRALQKAYQLFNETPSDKDFTHRDKIIAFVTDGHPSNIGEDFFEFVEKMNTEIFQNNITIMTFGIANVDEEGKALLQRISTTATNKPGTYNEVTDFKSIRDTIGTYFRVFGNKQHKCPVISLPYIDPFSKSLVVTVTLPLYDKGSALVGVVGTDLALLDTLHEYESPVLKAASSYAYVTNNFGEILAHPLVPCSGFADNLPVHVNINNVEKQAKGILRSCKNFTLEHNPHPHGVEEPAYRLCVVLRHNETLRMRNLNTSPQNVSFLYHKFGLLGYKDTCRHFSRSATKSSSVVMFGAQAFINPQRYLDSHETFSAVKKYVDEIKDPDTASILTVDAQHEVYITSAIEEIWLRTSHKNNTDDMSNWRYIATANGVLRMYPGVSLRKAYDPTVRPWYIKSRENKELLTMVGPYLDDFGSGYVITASKALLAMPRDRDILGVMGLDLSVNYLYSNIMETYPTCMTPINRCFLMDSEGYILVHPEFVTLHGLESPVASHSHITVKELSVAKHMIQAGHLTKHRCLDFCNSRHKYFYNVAVNESISHWDNELKYEISPINQTNTFLVIKQHEADSPECSCYQDFGFQFHECTEDFMNASCECPCYSRSDIGVCTNVAILHANAEDMVCNSKLEVEGLTGNREVDLRLLDNLGECWEADCSHRNNQMSCFQQSECNWCVLDPVGVKLSEPYCSRQVDCFFGQVGFPSPYNFYRSEVPYSGFTHGHLITIIILVVIFVAGLLTVILRWMKRCLCPTIHYDSEAENESEAVTTESRETLGSEDIVAIHSQFINSELVLAAADNEQQERFLSPAPDDPPDLSQDDSAHHIRLGYEEHEDIDREWHAPQTMSAEEWEEKSIHDSSKQSSVNTTSGTVQLLTRKSSNKVGVVKLQQLP